MKDIHIPTSNDLIAEIRFQVTRSSGPGGQNVNKVNSKVTLLFDVAHSALLDDEQKHMILSKLASRVSKEGIFSISSQESRSQLQNKASVLLKMDELFIKIFTPRKARKATRPGKAARQKRLKSKKHHSEKKQMRKRI